MKKAAIVLLLLGCFVMIQACASTPKLPDPKAGLYVNAENRFTVAYPEKWEAQALTSPNEVMRAANPIQYLLPVIATSVADLQPDASLDPKGFTEAVKASIPGTKRFKVLDQEDVTLNDGTPAKAFTYKWNWTDGATKLVSASLITIKDNKFYSSTVTTILGGDTKPETLLEIAKGWMFY